MKFHFEIINCKDSGSVYYLHIFAVYEGADSRQNMAKALQKFLRDSEEMQSLRFPLYRHKVKIILGGDYHFLYDVKHPLTLDHRRKHVGIAHRPENSPIVERTMKDLEASYDERLTDDRADDDSEKRREVS